jgi:large subunit ribosomal protein LP0
LRSACSLPAFLPLFGAFFLISKSYLVALLRLTAAQEYITEYPKVLIVAVDNVGSRQMQEIRQTLRGHGEVLMGKNTLIRKCLRGLIEKHPDLEKCVFPAFLLLFLRFVEMTNRFPSSLFLFFFCLSHRRDDLLRNSLMPVIKGNVGFVFSKEDLREVKKLILSIKVKAPAKAGALAPVDVWVPAGNTGMGPEKTSFFQVRHRVWCCC